MARFKLKKARKEKLEEDAMKDADFMKLDRKDNTDCYAIWHAYEDDERTCKK